MTRCKNGRKHVIVQEYLKKNGTDVSSHERACPRPQDTRQEEGFICCVCGEEYGLDEIHQIEIKDQIKNICKGCADIVHGLL
jgi:hypothetical protein